MTSLDEYIVPILTSLIPNIPVWLVWIGAVFVAVRRRDRHPRTSQFVLAGLFIFFVLNIVSTAIGIMLPIILRENGRSVTDIGVIFAAVSLVGSFVSAGAWSLILMAVFRWRDEDEQPKRKIKDLLEREL